MDRVRLTQKRIEEAICPSDKNQGFMWDTEVPRLAVRVTAAGAKSFVYETKLSRQTLRLTIGGTNAWTLEEARKEARRLQTLVDQGIDPREVKQQARAAREAVKIEAQRVGKYTLKALMDLYAEYCVDRGKLRHSRNVKSATKVHLVEAAPEMAKTPAKAITPEQIAELVRRVKESGKGRTAGSFRSYLAAAFNLARKAPLSGEIPSNFIAFGIKSNPVDPVPAIPVNPRQRALDQNELKAYLKLLDQTTTIDTLLKLALYAGGQRIAPMLRAKVEDFDPTQKTLRLYDPKGKRKVAREHLLPLGNTAAAILSGAVAKAKEKEADLIFAARTGGMIDDATPGKRVAEISADLGGEPFNLLDIRRTCETMLASIGVNRDIRAQLLSHGLSGVQSVHYDRHDYLNEKRAALVKWEDFLTQLLQGGTGAKVIQLRR